MIATLIIFLYSILSLSISLSLSLFLFLASNPRTRGQLQISREARQIEERLRVGTARDVLTFAAKWAVRRRARLADTGPMATAAAVVDRLLRARDHLAKPAGDGEP